MRVETLRAVRDLTAEGTERFHASFVASRAGISVEDARRDLAAMAKAEFLLLNLELMCPEDESTLAIFHVGDEIPATYQDWHCCDGKEFEVTPNLIWVTYSPTQTYKDEVVAETAHPPDRGGGAGKDQRPPRDPTARATCSQTTPRRRKRRSLP